MARSKWFFPNGEAEMRECEVIGYSKEQELFEIRWVGKDSKKKVSRFNLIFKNESESQFHKRIEEA
jgi:hypothetical protein